MRLRRQWTPTPPTGITTTQTLVSDHIRRILLRETEAPLGHQVPDQAQVPREIRDGSSVRQSTPSVSEARLLAESATFVPERGHLLGLPSRPGGPIADQLSQTRSRMAGLARKRSAVSLLTLASREYSRSDETNTGEFDTAPGFASIKAAIADPVRTVQ